LLLCGFEQESCHLWQCLDQRCLAMLRSFCVLQGVGVNFTLETPFINRFRSLRGEFDTDDSSLHGIQHGPTGFVGGSCLDMVPCGVRFQLGNRSRFEICARKRYCHARSMEVLVSRRLRIIVIVLGVLIVLLVIIPFLIPINRFRPTIEQKASHALGRKVQVEI
jgi:hypothetical protein